ncbi:fatty acid--CoA ligase family protein (plasmid) [Geminicoccaceae bacterium 1502E]|nr:fatty acid--CoA ligase family protein [Geminicoccaceae bacterium 1502E]
MNLTDSLAGNAARQPHAPAVVHPDVMLDHARLELLARRLAAALRARGLGPGDRVALTVQRPVLHVIAMLALARLGVAQLPLGQDESASRAAELGRRLKLAALVSDMEPAAQVLPLLRLDPVWLEEERPEGELAAARGGGGTAPWLFASSSGTTGAPKLYAASHHDEAVRARRDLTVFDFRQGEPYLNLVDLHFAVGRRRVLHCLMAGGCVFLPRPRTPPGEILTLIERHKIGHVSGTPSHAHAMLAAVEGGAPPPRALRILRIGAAAVPQALREEVRRRLTPNLYINYGSNEGGTIAAADPEIQRRLPGTVGRPMPGLEVEIVDGEDRPVPTGACGRVRLRGEGVIRGYIDDPAATAEAFRGGWFYPGDLACFTPEGALMHHGRADDVIVFDGINIHPGEIEQVLLTHPAVAEAVAFALANQRYQHVPAAVVVLHGDAKPADLLRFCGERLGRRMPQRLTVLPALPRGPTGKVSRRALAEEMAAAVAAQGARARPT